MSAVEADDSDWDWEPPSEDEMPREDEMPSEDETPAEDETSGSRARCVPGLGLGRLTICRGRDQRFAPAVCPGWGWAAVHLLTAAALVHLASAGQNEPDPLTAKELEQIAPTSPLQPTSMPTALLIPAGSSVPLRPVLIMRLVETQGRDEAWIWGLYSHASLKWWSVRPHPQWFLYHLQDGHPLQRTHAIMVHRRIKSRVRVEAQRCGSGFGA